VLAHRKALLHVAGVTEAHAGLRSALVAAVLQVHDALARSQLLLRELTHVAGCLLGPDAGLAEFRSLPAEGLQTDNDAVEVLPLPQVDGLEGLRVRHPERLGVGREGVDVLHALEGHGARLDLLHGSRLQYVDQTAEHLTVPEDLEEVVRIPFGADVLPENFLDPVQRLFGRLLRVLGVDLGVGLCGKSGFGGTVHDEGWDSVAGVV